MYVYFIFLWKWALENRRMNCFKKIVFETRIKFGNKPFLHVGTLWYFEVTFERERIQKNTFYKSYMKGMWQGLLSKRKNSKRVTKLSKIICCDAIVPDYYYGRWCDSHKLPQPQCWQDSHKQSLWAIWGRTLGAMEGRGFHKPPLFRPMGVISGPQAVNLLRGWWVLGAHKGGKLGEPTKES